MLTWIDDVIRWRQMTTAEVFGACLELPATRGEVARNCASTWWRVQCSVETGLLGFSHGRPWGTSVWLVSSGESWICTDLRLMSRVCLSFLDFNTAQSHGGCEMPWSLNPAEKYVWLQMVVCTCESSLLCRDVCLMPRTKFGSDTMLNISNAMCYTMLWMLEWMRKVKYRIGTLRTRALRDSALTAYIHGGIP